MTRRQRLRHRLALLWLSFQMASLFAVLTLAIFLAQAASRQMGWL